MSWHVLGNHPNSQRSVELTTTMMSFTGQEKLQGKYLQRKDQWVITTPFGKWIIPFKAYKYFAWREWEGEKNPEVAVERGPGVSTIDVIQPIRSSFEESVLVQLKTLTDEIETVEDANRAIAHGVSVILKHLKVDE